MFLYTRTSARAAVARANRLNFEAYLRGISMKMKRTSLISVAAVLMVAGFTGGMALGDDSAAATVNVKENASMLSLKDASKNDTYTVDLSDSQVLSHLILTCTPGSAGHLGGLIGRSNLLCGLTGSGMIINPKDPNQKVARTTFGGSYKVEDSGNVDATQMNIDYSPPSPTAESSFQGSLELKPEHPSVTASGFASSLLDQFNKDKKAGEVVDSRVDTLSFSNFCTPSAGFPSDKGTCWSGEGAFPYQKSAWYFTLKATYNGKDYSFAGNMPYIDDTATTADQFEYDVQLVENTGATNDQASTDALFADPTDPSNLFAAKPGIDGKLILNATDYTDYSVQGQVQHIPYLIGVTGQLTGTQVPLDVVRSFATIVSLLSRTMYGP